MKIEDIEIGETYFVSYIGNAEIKSKGGWNTKTGRNDGVVIEHIEFPGEPRTRVVSSRDVKYKVW